MDEMNGKKEKDAFDFKILQNSNERLANSIVIFF